jgi:hypothetical protein
MAASIIQQVKNSAAYQVSPLSLTLKSTTTAGSYLVVIVEAQKSGYPYASGSIAANTSAPIVTDDKGSTYTLVDKIVSVSQDTGVQPDAAGYFPSAYIYVSSAAVTAGAQTISVGAFYPDEYTSPIQPGGNPASPPVVNGRPVFDGGLHAQAFEVAGLATGVDVHAHGISVSGSNPLGPNLITGTGAGITFEVGVLIDSSTLISDVNSIQQHSSILYGGSTHFVVQSRITTGATASAGFGNALFYSGGVVAVALK